MAEQWIKAFAIELEALRKVVGGEAALVERALQYTLAEEVDELVEEADFELEALLHELVSGRLVEENAYGYRRSLELVASVVGEDLPWEAVMPGRGWQELGAAWASWGLVVLGKHWGGGSDNNQSRWPWPPTSKSWNMWPIAVEVPNRSLSAIAEELDAFDEKVVIERGVPTEIDRFGDPDYWSPEQLATQLAEVVIVVRAFVARARELDLDLLLWHDGQQ